MTVSCGCLRFEARLSRQWPVLAVGFMSREFVVLLGPLHMRIGRRP